MAHLRGQTGSITFASGPVEGTGVYIQKWSAEIENVWKDVSSFSNNVDGAPLLLLTAQNISGRAEGFLGTGVGAITAAMLAGGAIGSIPANSFVLTADTASTFTFLGVMSNISIGTVSVVAGENPVPITLSFRNSGAIVAVGAWT